MSTITSISSSFNSLSTDDLNKRSTPLTEDSPTTPKRNQYVFRTINHHRNHSQIEPSSQLQQQNKMTFPIGLETFKNGSNLVDLKEKLKASTPSSLLFTNAEQDKEIHRLRTEVAALKESLAKITSQNGRLKQQNSELAPLRAKNIELEQEIQRIKDQYVQTSLDCFNEALRGEFQKIASLKAQLEVQAEAKEVLQASLEESHRRCGYLQVEMKSKGDIFERELRSQQQRFQVRLSDKDNQIQDLRHALESLQQRHSLIVNQLKVKDEFLMKLSSKSHT